MTTITLTPSFLSHVNANGAAEVKTYRFSGRVKSVDVVSDTGNTSILFHVESGNISLDKFRVHFNKETGKATHAWWMTKGGSDISLPKESLMLKDMPKQGSEVRVEFDHDVPKKSSSIEVIGLLSVVAQKSSNTPPAKK